MRIHTLIAMIAGSAALGTGSPALAHDYPDHGVSGYISFSSGPYYGPHVAGTLGYGNVLYIPPRPAYYDHAYFYPGCGHWHAPSHYHARLYSPYRVHDYVHGGGW